MSDRDGAGTTRSGRQDVRAPGSDSGIDRAARAGRLILRRAPLFVVLAILVWLYLGNRPREVTILYDLPDRPPPTRVDVTIRAVDGSVPAALSWGSGGAVPAADRQGHEPLLAPGDYRVRATLTYADGSSRDVERDLPISREDERIVVYLTGP